MNPSIAIILPAYNEEVTIEKVIRDFHLALPEAAIYVINNNSKDRTGELAKKTLNSIDCGGAVIEENRQGKGNALRRAFLEIDADVYVISDADLTYPASRVRDLISPIIEGCADMAVGDRHSGGNYSSQNKRYLHGFGNELVKSLINILSSSNLRDIMSGYRAYSRKFIKNYPIIVDGFQVETEMTLHALDKRFRIVEIPVEYVDRPPGSFSKLNTLSDGLLVLSTIAQILRYYKPLAFFGSIAMITAVVGVVMAIPVFDDWITHKYIYHVPLAILAASLEIVAMIMLCVGLVLDSISHQQRFNYELRLHAEH